MGLELAGLEIWYSDAVGRRQVTKRSPLDLTKMFSSQVPRGN